MIVHLNNIQTFIIMVTSTVNNKNVVTDQKIDGSKRITTPEKKMNQMRNTLKKHPIPFSLLKK